MATTYLRKPAHFWQLLEQGIEAVSCLPPIAGTSRSVPIEMKEGSTAGAVARFG